MDTCDSGHSALTVEHLQWHRTLVARVVDNHSLFGDIDTTASVEIDGIDGTVLDQQIGKSVQIDTALPALTIDRQDHQPDDGAPRHGSDIMTTQHMRC
jgi:hypothetical protein